MTTTLDLAAIGITSEELQDRIIERLVESLLTSKSFDEYGDHGLSQSSLRRALDKRIQEQINAAVDRLADEHVLPNVNALIEGWTLQATSSWGEKRGEPMSFTEYLVQRADAYMREPVNSAGKDKATESYSWSAHSTRIAFMINQHLQYSIDTAMKHALANANSSIVGGLEGAVKLALAEAAKRVSVKVETK